MLAAFDHSHAIAYTYMNSQEEGARQASGQEGFAGLQILTEKAIRHYAFDNDGHNGSIRINDGFGTQEKFTSMTSGRDNAGSYRAGNDVSSMLAAGPFDMPPGDTARIAFALHIADTYSALTESAMRSFDVYNKLILGDGTIHVNHPEETELSILTAYPNPFGSSLHVTIHFPTEASNKMYGPELKLFIHDMLGRPVYQKLLMPQPGMTDRYTIDTGNLIPGYYLISIASKAGLVQKKLFKYQ